MRNVFGLVLCFLMIGCSIQGTKGDAGSSGRNGHNAMALLLNTSSGGGIKCANGGTTLLVGLDINNNGHLDPTEIAASQDICNGSDGKDGLNGTNGTNGSNGQDGKNGSDGQDGSDATISPFTPVSILNPCGDAPGIYDEVFVKLQNGIILASFSDNTNGNNTRFSVLTPGSYMTTDGDRCTFTIDSNGDFTYQSHVD